mmetsp:Transcript_3637/g.7583  ORF Transcript_3637/g.7583 Transcript_3637/m.7583 type:complete len:261 (-) Transcript_3637:418-1200(-)
MASVAVVWPWCMGVLAFLWLLVLPPSDGFLFFALPSRATTSKWRDPRPLSTRVWLSQQPEESSSLPPVMNIHHTALKTRNITNAIQFYSLLGFSVQHKFRAGPARAAWLQLASSPSSRLEVIEVPGYMLQEEPGMRKRALDLMKRPELLGFNHLALDVTDQVKCGNSTSNTTTGTFADGTLLGYMKDLNATSWQRFNRTLRVALQPKQQLIGNEVYELGFIYDADGCLVEFLHKQSQLSQDIDSGWDPWDGSGFVGGISS